MAATGQSFGIQATVRANIDLNSRFDAPFVTMNTLATLIACYGLFENSPAVVIGAMIIAMLLGPISGVALGLVERNNPLLRRALSTFGRRRVRSIRNGIPGGPGPFRVSADQ